MRASTFKGSSPHLQRATNLHKCSSADSLRPLKNTWKILDPSAFPLRNEKQKCYAEFLFIFFVF